MLFQSRFHDGIRRGEITCTIRIWHSPRVRVGGTYQLGAGSIHVDRIQEMEFDGLTPTLARRSGFSSVVELLKVAKHGAGERIFLIDFHYVAAPAKRKTNTQVLAAGGLEELIAKLDAMDRRATSPWTRQTLREIEASPGLRSTELALNLGRERVDLKTDIRKLKALGLTLSMDVGYRLSARGVQVLTRKAKRGKKRSRLPSG
jgi:hypothetical protein